MGPFLVLFLFFTWSSSFPLGKEMLQYTSPIFAVGLRMTLAGLVLMGYLFFRSKIPKLSFKQILSILLLGLFSIFFTNILEFWSLTHLSAAKTCFLYGLSPFLTAILSYFHFSEKMTPLKCLGLTIGFTGFIPVILDKSGTEGLLSAFSCFTWPELAMFGAVFTSVYGWIILRLIVRNNSISPLLANGGSMLFGGVLAFALQAFLTPSDPFPVVAGGWQNLLFFTILLTILSNILCYNLYGYLLKRYTATLLSLFGLLSPVFVSIHSWVILNEKPSLSILASTCIVLLGLFIVYSEEKRLGYLTKQTD